MKNSLTLVLGLAGLTALAPATFGAEKSTPPKAYPLDTCLVSDEKLGADPGMQTFVFTHEGQEIKLCCKSCQKQFNKDTAKYLKKLDTAAKAKAKPDKK